MVATNTFDEEVRSGLGFSVKALETIL